MQPRTLSALAVAAGLTLGTGVLAIGATLMPSGASPRPYAPVAADVASDPGTTIVTDVQTVYDDPPPAAQSETQAPAGADAQPESVESGTQPAPTPVVTATPAPSSTSSVESSGDDHESEHDFVGEQEHDSSSSGGSVDD